MKKLSIWNFYAKAYDAINQNMPYLKMLDDVIKEAHINEGAKVLDAGCGTGNLLKKMTATSNAKFIGVDSSEEMLCKAKNKFLSNPSVAIMHSDLDSRLKFPDGSFGYVVSVNTLYALREPQKTIAEFYRILRPQGKLVFANPHDASTFAGIMKGQLRELGMLRFIMRFLSNLPALIIIIFVNVFYLRRNKNHWSKDQAEDILKGIGFTEIKTNLTYADQSILMSAIKP